MTNRYWHSWTPAPTKHKRRRVRMTVRARRGQLVFVVREFFADDKISGQERADQTIHAYKVVDELPWCRCGRKHGEGNYCG